MSKKQYTRIDYRKASEHEVILAEFPMGRFVKSFKIGRAKRKAHEGFFTMQIYALGDLEHYVVKSMYDDRYTLFAKCQDSADDPNIKEFSHPIGSGHVWSPYKRKHQEYLKINIPALNQNFYMDMRIKAAKQLKSTPPLSAA